MPQIFNRNINHQVKTGIVVLLLGLASAFGAAQIYYWGPAVTGQYDTVEQPVQFTHEHHVSGLGLDCRYCHINVEKGAYAEVPPVKVCMTCHSQMYTEEELLAPIRESYATEVPIQWVKVHNLSDFVYFDHSAHINKGVGCAECHGRVDQMALVHQEHTLHMSWCLECHFEPEKYIRPKDKITDMDYVKHLEEGSTFTVNGKVLTQKELAQEYHVQSKISCSTCHR